MKTLVCMLLLFTGYFSGAKATQFSKADTPHTSISKDSAQQLLEVVVHDDPWNDNTRATIKTCILAGANPDTRYGSVFWSLMQGVADDGNIALAEFLIQNKADINWPDADGFTALHQAVYKSNKDMVKLLLKHKANVNAMDDMFRTPFDMAADKEIQKLLKAKGGKPGAKLKKQ